MANGKVTFSAPVAEDQFYSQALGSDVNALIDQFKDFGYTILEAEAAAALAALL